MKRSEIKPDPKNVNKGTARGAAIVKASLEEHGAGRAILADKRGVIIAGNTTFREWKKLGRPIRILDSDGGELVVIRRKDLDLKNPSTRKLQAVDNQATVVGLEWDAALLRALEKSGQELADGVLFTADEWDALIDGNGKGRDSKEPPSSKTRITAEHRCPNCGKRIRCGSKRAKD